MTRAVAPKKKPGTTGLRATGRKRKAEGTHAPPAGRKYDKKLTSQQELFVARYLCSFNAIRAHMEAFKSTYANAHANSFQLMKHPLIKARIKAFVDSEKKRLEVTARNVLDEAAALAFSNIGDLFDAKGNMKHPGEVPRSVAVAIKKFSPGNKQTPARVEMHDKMAPLRALGQHVGVLKEQLEVSATGEFADLLREARERSAQHRK